MKKNDELRQIIKEGNLNKFKLIFEENIDDKEDAFTCAIFHGKTEIVEWLIVEKNIHVNKLCGDLPPIFIAYFGKQLEIIKLLIKHGANVDVVEEKSGSSCLENSVYNGDSRAVRFWLENGANINARNKYGETFLFISLYTNNMEMGRFLIDEGIDVNAKIPEQHNNTCLMTAVMWHRNEIIESLLNNNADLTVKNDKQENVFDFAKKYNNSEALKLLETEVLNRQDFRHTCTFFPFGQMKKKQDNNSIIKFNYL